MRTGRCSQVASHLNSPCDTSAETYTVIGSGYIIVEQPDSTYPLVIKPFSLDVSKLGENEHDKMEFTITNVSDQDLDLSVIDLPHDMFDVKLPETLKAGNTANCELQLHDGATKTAFVKSITLQVNDANLSRFTIPVKRTLPKTVTTADTGKKKKR